MKKAKAIIFKLLYPPKWVICIASVVGFGAVIPILALGYNDNPVAYFVYCLSAYALTVLIAAAPDIYGGIRNAVKNNAVVRKISGTELGERYLNDLSFRGSVSIYQGMTVNFLYVVFRIVAGIRYASVWFISMAVYYLVLGILRVYLILCRRRKFADKLKSYRRTAWLLFLLNIPMGGMIFLMIRTNSGFSYPGYIIYLSAAYTFYTMIISVVNLVRFRRLGDPVLSAAKVLNFVSALMSILGLQTAMIARFSKNSDDYRKLMNTLTGSAVYGIVIVTAVYMIRRSKKLQEKEVGHS